METTTRKGIDVRINDALVLRILIAIIAVLCLVSFGMQFWKFVVTPDSHVFHKLGVNSEGNVATFFSTLILLITATLLLYLAFLKKRLRMPYVRHWTLLAVVFFYLSLDEAAGIHEKFNKITQGVFHENKGIFLLAWVIPFSVLVLVFVLSYLRFLWHLPVRSRLLFISSGLIYILGAIGMEIVGGYYVQANGDTLLFQLILTIEEMMEMVGISLFIFSLLDYLRRHMPAVNLTLQF